MHVALRFIAHVSTTFIMFVAMSFVAFSACLYSAEEWMVREHDSILKGTASRFLSIDK